MRTATLGGAVGRANENLGHTGPARALRVYPQAMSLSAAEQAQLRALIERAQLADDENAQLADIGSETADGAAEDSERHAA